MCVCVSQTLHFKISHLPCSRSLCSVAGSGQEPWAGGWHLKALAPEASL